MDLTPSLVALDAHQNRSMDFSSREFIGWAYKAYISKGLLLEYPHLSHPFATGASIYTMNGKTDMVQSDTVDFFSEK